MALKPLTSIKVIYLIFQLRPVIVKPMALKVQLISERTIHHLIQRFIQGAAYYMSKMQAIKKLERILRMVLWSTNKSAFWQVLPSVNLAKTFTPRSQIV